MEGLPSVSEGPSLEGPEKVNFCHSMPSDDTHMASGEPLPGVTATIRTPSSLKRDEMAGAGEGEELAGGNSVQTCPSVDCQEAAG